MKRPLLIKLVWKWKWLQPKLKTTVVETGVVETGVAGIDAAVEEEVETEGAAVIVLVAVAEAEVCFCFDLQNDTMPPAPPIISLILDPSTSTF